MKKLQHMAHCLRQLIREISRLEIGLYAANASFFITLSIFPGFLLLLGLLNSLPADLQQLGILLQSLMPAALLEGAAALLRSADLSGTSLSVSALTAAWSAGKGVHGIIAGLNAVYGLEESRGYFRTRLLSGVFTLILLVMLVLSLGLQMLFSGPWLRILLPVSLQTAVFAAMYRTLPNGRSRLGSCLPGAILASFGWLGFSALFSVYAVHFAPLRNVYGSLYMLALGMLWLYCCMAIVLFGGAWNRWLLER